MPANTSAERSLAASIGAHTSWALTPNRTERTANGRTAFLQRFEVQVDPDGTLSAAERSRRAEHLRKAYFKQLALKSAQSRRRAKEATADALAAEAELDALGGDAS